MVAETENKPVTVIRLIDPFILKLIHEEQQRTGEATATRTAGRLIAERVAMRQNHEFAKGGRADAIGKSESSPSSVTSPE